MGRQLGAAWSGWRSTGGVGSQDPEILPLGNSLAIVVLTASGTPFYGTFPAGDFGSTVSVNWTSTNQTFTSATGGSNGTDLFIASKDGTGTIWWYQQGQWIDSSIVAPGLVDAAESPSLVHAISTTYDLPMFSGAGQRSATVTTDCPGVEYAPVMCYYSSIEYMPPNQIFGVSGTLISPPYTPLYTNYTSNVMWRNGVSMGSTCGESVILKGGSAVERVPCNPQNNFSVSASDVYTLAGTHRSTYCDDPYLYWWCDDSRDSNGDDLHSYDSLGFVAAGATVSFNTFNNIPLDSDSNYTNATGPLISGGNGGITVNYTAKNPRSVSVSLSVPYSAVKGRHQIAFPTTDKYNQPKVNAWFAIVVYDRTPVLTNVSPNWVIPGGQNTLMLTGTGFGDHPTVYVGGTAYQLGAPTQNQNGDDVIVFSATVPASYSGSTVPIYVQSNGAGGQPFFGAPQATGAPQGSPVGNTRDVPVIKLSLTPTDPSFVPVNSLNSWETCTPNTNCYTKYTATISPAGVTGTIRFQVLSTHFYGDSTNRCFLANGDTDVSCTDPINGSADYFFDPARQAAGLFQAPSTVVEDPMMGQWEQTIQTNPAVNSANVWVSSRDYGGYGSVTATATINGVTVSAQVNGQNLPAALPVDVNGDYIADAWEQQMQLPMIDPSADAEVNSNGAPPGDGFSGFEEYRGFVLIQANSCAPGCTLHERTNPLREQDVFVADPNGLFELYGFSLTNETPFVYHALSIDLASPLDTSTLDPKRGLTNLRRSYTNHQSEIFAIDLVIDNSLGTDSNGDPILAAAGTPNNDGFPVTLSVTGISATAMNRGYLFPVLMYQTLAHEVGHKFGLLHYRETRPVEPTLAGGTTQSALIANPGLLPTTRYAPCYLPICGLDYHSGGGNDTIHQKFWVWIQVDHSGGGARRQSEIAQPQSGDLAGISPSQNGGWAYDVLMSPNPQTDPQMIAQYTIQPNSMNPPQQLPTPPTQIDLWIQRNQIMDYTARLSSTTNSPGFWHFDPTLDKPFMVLCKTTPQASTCPP